jgi:hypothetical protein
LQNYLDVFTSLYETEKKQYKEENMDVKNYEALISSVSQEIAENFLSLEENIPQRALFIDADIAEITRLIGLETTQQVYEKVLKRQVDQKKTKG